MIEVKKLQNYFLEDKIFITAHAAERFHQRGITIKDIRNAINSGEIIEQYPDDYPIRVVWWSGDFKLRRH